MLCSANLQDRAVFAMCSLKVSWSSKRLLTEVDGVIIDEPNWIVKSCCRVGVAGKTRSSVFAMLSCRWCSFIHAEMSARQPETSTMNIYKATLSHFPHKWTDKILLRFFCYFFNLIFLILYLSHFTTFILLLLLLLLLLFIVCLMSLLAPIRQDKFQMWSYYSGFTFITLVAGALQSGL